MGILNRDLYGDFEWGLCMVISYGDFKWGFQMGILNGDFVW